MSIYSIGGFRVRMSPLHEPLKSQAVPYFLEEDESGGFDISALMSEEYLQARKHRYSDVGACEYMIASYLFYRGALEFDAIMLHASAVAVGGTAYLFSAPCGTGKSTHTQNWLKVFASEDPFLLNDDKPLLLIRGGKVFAAGTPFSGKTDQSRNVTLPVGGVCFLERGEKNAIFPLDKSEIFEPFYLQTLKPKEPDRMEMLFSHVEKLTSICRFYRLVCNMDPASAVVARRGMDPGSAARPTF